MQISDGAKILNDGQKKLVLDITTKHLKAKALLSQMSLLKIVHGCPASEFEDDERTIITLHIRPEHFSKPNIEFIIFHEIQHRIDELNPSFGYDKSKKEKLNREYGQKFSGVLAHLWDVYIDGRLAREGLYQTDPNETIIIKAQTYKRDKVNNRLAGINFLQTRGIREAEQVYDKIWAVKDGELSYNQLTQLALDNMTC